MLAVDVSRSMDDEEAGCSERAMPRRFDCLKGERDRQMYSDPYFPQLDAR